MNASGFNRIAPSFAALAAGLTILPLVSAAEPLRLAVTHFENRTEMNRLDYLGQQLPEMIVTELAQYDGLILLERERVDRLLEERHDIRMDTLAGIKAAVILTGHYEKDTWGLMLSVELIRLGQRMDSPWTTKLVLSEQRASMEHVAEDLAREVRIQLDKTSRKVLPQASANIRKKYRLAVLYLNDNSPLSERLALQKGLTDLIIHSLDAVQEIEALEREEISEIINERILAMSGRATGSGEGSFGTLDAIVLGTYITQVSPPALRVDLRLVHPLSGVILGAQKFRSTKEGIQSLEKEMREWILMTLSIPPPSVSGNAGVHSLEALHYYSQALDHIDNGNILQAVRAIKGAMYIDPDYVHAHFSVGKIYEEQLGEFVLAAEAYRRVSVDTGSADREAALVRLGQVAVLHGARSSDGPDALWMLLRDYPATLYADLAYYLLAKSCENDGNADSAIQYYTIVKTRYPSSPLAVSAETEINHLIQARRPMKYEAGPKTFRETFDSGLARWTPRAGPWAIRSNAELAFDTENIQKQRYWITVKDLSPRSFTIEADLIGSSIDGGLTARFAGGGKFVAFVVRQNQKHKDFLWVKRYGRHKSKAQQTRWTRPKGDRVRLKLKVTNIKLEAFINGRKVSELIDEHNITGPPGLNLWPYGNQTFDNVVITVIDDRTETVAVFKTK